MFGLAFPRPNPRSYLLNVATFCLGDFWGGQLERVLASQPAFKLKQQIVAFQLRFVGANPKVRI